MAESFFAKITPVQGGPTDPGFGQPEPKPPNQIWPPKVWPPLPPDTQPPQIWPPQINNDLPPDFPIVIPQPPEKPTPGLPPVAGHPLPEPPGGPSQLPELPNVIWPPLPPGTGIAGKALILIWVVGVGYRWMLVQGPDLPPGIWPKPPVGGGGKPPDVATPK